MLDASIYEVPFTDICQKELGTILPTNIMSLAYMVKVTGIVSDSSLKKAVKETVRKRFFELNSKAIKLGFTLADKHLKERG